MLKKLLLPFLFVAFFVNMAFAQTGSITGTVTNEEGEPVPTANVLLVEVNRGAATNLQGEYTIKNVQAGTYTLRVTFVGYADYTDEVTIETGQALTKNVTLKRGAVGLEELVVTGFGVESKIEYTGSAASVDVGEQIENVPVVNISSALQGSVTGLNITAASGTPGSAVDINIRGVSSINAGGDPLVVLDGVPIVTDSPQFGLSTEQGVIANIPPQSIKSINVLKGPVATAQYGAEGANGVIVITTKTGTAGEARYSVSYQRGAVSRAVPFPEMANAFEYAALYREAQINADKLKGSDPVPEPEDIDVPNWNGKTNTNWTDVITNDNATTQQFTISASGGTKEATYFGSLSYQNAESAVISSGFERFAGSFNFSYDFNENIDVSNQFLGSFSELAGIREGAAYFANPTSAPLFMLPVAPAYNQDGSIYTGDKLTNYNPVWIAKYDVSRTRNYQFVNSTKLNIDLMDDLVLHSELGINFNLLTEKAYANPEHGWAAGDLNGLARVASNRSFLGTWQNGVTYRFAINENHSFKTQVVNIIKLYKFQQIVTSASGFPTMGLTTVESASTPLTAISFLQDGSQVSVLGKVHYSYKDKLFFDGTIRREGNSRFAVGYRWGTFYGIGAAWLVSAEDFMNGSNVIDLLKIRGSFGVSGNNAIGRNEYQSFIGFADAYNNIGAIYPDQLGNPVLTWEKRRSMEVGLTFGLFNRIDGDVTVFRNKTYDLLYSVPLSRTTGFNSQLTNVGELVGKGIELSLNIDAIRTEDFLVSLNGNFTYLSNEVTELPTDATGTPLTVLNRMRYVSEGHPVDEWYMRTYVGVNKSNGLALWELNREPTQAEIDNGTAFKLDRFGDQWLTSNFGKANREYQNATPIPTHYGSVGITLNYKGFYAGASLYGSFGNKIYDGYAEYYHSDGEFLIYGEMASELDRWQKPGDITDTPKYVDGGNRNSNGNSTRFLYDASFLRLQTLRVGYNVPVTLLSKLNIGVRNLNIFLTATNLWTYKFDDDLQWGPSADDTGFLDVNNQIQQSVTVGINVQF